MPGDLPRTLSGRRSAAPRRTSRRGVALAIAGILLLAGARRAAAAQAAPDVALPAAAVQQLSEVRRLSGCPALETEDVGRERAVRGRASLEIAGRQRGGDPSAPPHDFAVFDSTLARVVSYVCFANASTRKSGEAIMSLAEASSRADRLARALLPGSKLELESIRRQREDGKESIYYEPLYASAEGEHPFLEPPVRLLLNAESGFFFRLDIDPDWLDPITPPRARISRKAAERIATVVLRGRDLAPAFGAGAVLGTVAVAELFTVRPNGWLNFFGDHAESRARLAWVVPFRVDGGTAAGLHQLYVDAGTGRIVGGLSGRAAEPPPR